MPERDVHDRRADRQVDAQVVDLGRSDSGSVVRVDDEGTMSQAGMQAVELWAHGGEYVVWGSGCGWVSHFGQSLRAVPEKRSTYDGRPTLPWLAVNSEGGLVQGEIAEWGIYVSRKLVCDGGGRTGSGSGSGCRPCHSQLQTRISQNQATRPHTHGHTSNRGRAGTYRRGSVR